MAETTAPISSTSVASNPTWARHSTQAPADIQEIGKALHHPYPYFLAPLSPERTFLHYLISGMICNVQLHDRMELQTKVHKLYKENIGSVTAEYETNRATIDDNKDFCAQMAGKYFDERLNNAHEAPRTQLSAESGTKKPSVQLLAHRLKRLHQELVATNNDPALSNNTREWVELSESFGIIYDYIHNHMADSINPYKPGKTPFTGLRCAKDVFIAICQDELLREDIDQLVKNKAKKLIEDSIADRRLKPLPVLTAGKSKTTIITGVIAAGKNRLLSALETAQPDLRRKFGLEGKEKLDRSKCVVIDVDEFRDLDRLLGSKEEKDNDPNWGANVHDECHMIRRKILDELNAQEEKGIYRDVVLMTSHVSTRIHRWMTRNNKHVDLYCLYCDKDKAVSNAQLRARRDNGYDLPGHIIPRSFRDLANTLAFIFGVETRTKNNLKIRLLDTSAVKTEDKTINHSQAMLDARTIMTADDDHGIQVYDMEALRKVYAGEHLSTTPDILHNMQAYPDIAADVYNTMKASLWPHRVTVHSLSNSEKIAFKDRKEDIFTGDLHTLYAEYPSLKAIYDDPAPVQGKSPYGVHSSRVMDLRKTTGLGGPGAG